MESDKYYTDERVNRYNPSGDNTEIYSKENVIKEALQYVTGEKELKTPPKHPRKSWWNSQSVDSVITESLLKDKDLLGESDSHDLGFGEEIREEKVVKRLNDKNFLYIPKYKKRRNGEKKEVIDMSQNEVESNQESENLHGKHLNDLNELSKTKVVKTSTQKMVKDFEEKVIKRLNDENYLLIPKVGFQLLSIYLIQSYLGQ